MTRPSTAQVMVWGAWAGMLSELADAGEREPVTIDSLRAKARAIWAREITPYDGAEIPDPLKDKVFLSLAVAAKLESLADEAAQKPALLGWDVLRATARDFAEKAGATLEEVAARRHAPGRAPGVVAGPRLIDAEVDHPNAVVQLLRLWPEASELADRVERESVQAIDTHNIAAGAQHFVPVSTTIAAAEGLAALVVSLGKRAPKGMRQTMRRLCASLPELRALRDRKDGAP